MNDFHSLLQKLWTLCSEDGKIIDMNLRTHATDDFNNYVLDRCPENGRMTHAEFFGLFSKSEVGVKERFKEWITELIVLPFSHISAIFETFVFVYFF